MLKDEEKQKINEEDKLLEMPKTQFQGRFKYIILGLTIAIVICFLIFSQVVVFSKPPPADLSFRDPSSQANVHQFITTNISLDFYVNFEERKLSGIANLTFQSLKWDVLNISLDTRNLTIYNITDENGSKLEYQQENDDPRASWKGTRLVISLIAPCLINTTYHVSINQSTISNPFSLQWINKDQTVGKILPQVYSQCETIGCRSIFPLQDTPQVKSPQQAKIRIKNIDDNQKFEVYMSGNRTRVVPIYQSPFVDYYFESTINISSYLIAFVVGFIEKKPIIPEKEIQVITEPKIMENCTKELQLLPNYLETIANWLTPYEWGSYSIVILPPGFPWGGMENPLITFASPSIIIGDGSQNQIAIHEIAHSWFGNLASTKSWQHYYISDWLTVFTERKITEIFDKAKEKEIWKLESYEANVSLQNQMKMNNNSKLSYLNRLFLNNSSAYPEDAFSVVGLEKGFQLAVYLQSVLPRQEEDMQKFLRKYIKTYNKKSIDSEQIMQLFENFTQENNITLKAKVNWDEWFNREQVPSNPQISFETENVTNAKLLAEKIINGTAPENYTKIVQEMHKITMKIFLNEFIERKDEVTEVMLQKLEQLNFTNQADMVISSKWFELVAATNYSKEYIDARMKEYLGQIGRHQLIIPVYQRLASTRLEFAREIFAKYQDFYHPIVAYKIKKILQL